MRHVGKAEARVTHASARQASLSVLFELHIITYRFRCLSLSLYPSCLACLPYTLHGVPRRRHPPHLWLTGMPNRNHLWCHQTWPNTLVRAHLPVRIATVSQSLATGEVVCCCLMLVEGRGEVLSRQCATLSSKMSRRYRVAN